LGHTLSGVDDVLAGRTEALRTTRGDFAVVVTLETLARRLIRARELVIGAVDVAVAELRYVEADAVRARRPVHGTLFGAVLAAVLV
jgi:hypothetical protein